ncbi:MAG: CoA pyrophosphatase [Chloroflexi bacterium]|nr:CoA pyrophosphatase [Chloroflexota bacterium]
MRLEAALRAQKSNHPESRWPQSEAAVAVLLWGLDSEPSLLLMRRSMHVQNYKGHIAFPGGSREPEDASLADTAVREAVEELGVNAKEIEVWGDLDTVYTMDGMPVTPYTGRLRPDVRLRPDPAEVGSILAVPVAELVEPGAERDESRIVDGRVISRPTYSYNGNVVWGATARILAQLIPIARAVWTESVSAGD